ncbi:hypothetical protein D3C86_941580 [compost metagenome]
MVEGKSTIVYYVARDGARGATIADLKRAAGNGRAPAVAVGTGQDQCSRTGLGQRRTVPARSGIGGLVTEHRAHLESVCRVGQRERAMSQIVARRPAEAVAGNVLLIVVSFTGVDSEIVHNAGKATNTDGAKVPADAGGRIDQDVIKLAAMVDATDVEGNVISECKTGSLKGWAARRGGDRERCVIGESYIASDSERRQRHDAQPTANDADVAGQTACAV